MFAVLAAAAAVAMSPSPSPSASPVPEIAHVVTSDRGLESASRAARTTYVVTAADIARNGYRTVADALANVPGVNLARYGAFGALTTLGIRGSSSQQVLVLLDGLPIAGSQIENVNLEQNGVAGIDRIEVVEGGGSTLYGSGSIGGVINIITTGQAPATATVSTGSFGQQSYQFQSPYVSFQRTYAANDFGLPDGSTRQNANAGLTAVTATYSHAFGNAGLSLLGDLSSMGVRVPGPTGFYSPTSWESTLANDLRAKIERHGARSTLSFSLGESRQDLSYNCNSPADSNCPNGYPPSPAPAPYTQLLYDARVMADASDTVAGDRERIVYGVDLSRGAARIDEGTGNAAYPGAPPVSNPYAQSALYVQSQWFWPNGGEIYAGVRGELDSNAQANARGGAISPSIGGIVPLAGGLQLKLNAATAFRAPTAEELFYPPEGVFSNPSLVPERTRVGDATLVENSRAGQLSFGWFTTSGSNLIVDANPAAYDYEPVNIGRASIQGFTLSLASATLDHLATTVSVTNLYRAQDLVTQTRIVGRGPVFATTVGLRYVTLPSSRFDGGGVTISNSGLAETPSPSVPYWAQAAAFTTVDAYFGYRIAPKLVLALRGYNLLDDRYAVYNGYPMPGPSFALELRSR